MLGTTAVAALTACGLVEDKVPGSAAQVAADPDATLVDEAIARISAAATLTAQVPRLSALHAAHLEALEAEPPATPTDGATSAPVTRGQLRRTERDLQRFLVDASMRAESGPLARLFASMSAALSQQLVVLSQGAS